MKFSSIWLLLCFLLGSMASELVAQDAVEGNYDYMRRETAPGLSIVILGQPKSIEEVVEQIFREVADERAGSTKGMMEFDKTRFAPISAERMNYYFTVEKPSRRDDEHSRVTLFMQGLEGDFVTSVNYPRTIANAKIWLADLELETKVYEMGLVIEEQQKVVEKALQTQQGLVQDSIKLREEMAENQQALTDQKEEVSEAEQQLKAFEAKLRSLREERDILQEARRRARTRLDTGRNNR